MQYREGAGGKQWSALGFGCMRFPRNGNGIDAAEAEREILRAVELGVNYFDTAYIYPGSEECLGTILEKNRLRERVMIATKLPQYMIASAASIEKHFQEQCRRLKTDYIDQYLMHMLTDLEAWEKLCRLGIREWIAEKKRTGAIRQIGFSFHGNAAVFLKILEAYDWDFCQIQYNYMDEVSQAGRVGLRAAAARGIPVVIMEPLRGGKLVSLLPEKARQLIAAEGQGRTAAELAFRWLWDQPEVTCVLSGMNSMEMLEANCRVASEALPGCMDLSERQLIEKLKAEINAKLLVGCTGCGYCMPCPRGVDIPGTFRSYNLTATENRVAGLREYFQTVSLRKDPPFPSQCVGCGKCEKHCPQHLPIIQELKKADKVIRPWYVKSAITVARKWMFRGKGGTAERAEPERSGK